MKKTISALLIGTALTLATGSLALAQDKTVKIGALSDQSGLYADLGGPGAAEVGIKPRIIGQHADLRGLVLRKSAAGSGKRHCGAKQNSRNSIFHIGLPLEFFSHYVQTPR